MENHDLLEPPWPNFNNTTSSSLDEGDNYIFALDDHEGPFDFPPPFTTPEDSSDISMTIPDFPNMVSNDHFINLPNHVDDDLDITLPNDDFSLDWEEFEPVEEVSKSLENCESNFSSQQVIQTLDKTPFHPSLVLPTEEMEIDNQISIIHLLKAYGEAMENGQQELAEAIVKCISEKVSPVGRTIERVLYYLFQPSDKQSEYLKQESGKNFLAAFKAFYQIFIYGKFAHFLANLAIIEAMPHDIETIHIIDFDIGEGVQWSFLIEAIARQQKAVRLTSIQWGSSEGYSNFGTSRRFYEHAQSIGLRLKMEEMEIHDLVFELMKMEKNSGERRPWLVFNCMVGLPHMGGVRNRRDVMEFLKIANEILAYKSNCNTSDKGMITFGDGDSWEELKNSSNFQSFLYGNLVHNQALLESMELSFPSHLGEARTAMECLFISPFVSSHAWIQKWEEVKECCNEFQLGFGLEGWKVSKESLMEAKEMVREGESLYGVRVEGVQNNMIVLEWKGIPLVKVSSWSS